MTDRHFFSEAASLSWWEWLKRKSLFAFLNPAEPRCIPSELSKTPIPKLSAFSAPTRAKAENAAEYSLFLQRHFYPSSAPVELYIPQTTLSILLETQFAIGAEIRDADKNLVGCVFDMYAGHVQSQPTGLVSWFCIHPSWRKRGIGSVLLFALYSFSQPRQIHWWRNDGGLRSPLPPIWSDIHLVRPIYCMQTSIVLRADIAIHRAPLQEWKQSFKETWLKKNPAGICLENPANRLPSIQEVWEARFSKTRVAAVLIQPTYEIQRQGRKRYCEVIAYAWKDEPKTEYEQAVLLEKILDHLPYDLIEITESFPHLDHGWKSIGQTSWSCIGLDPGNPVQRPILPLWCA
jgi:GNAT superfamily N-acetyltransferase